MYYIIIDGKHIATYPSNEMLEAWEEAASLDYIYNSPELNDGVQRHHRVELLSLDDVRDRNIELTV
jgi:hypothetical protein